MAVKRITFFFFFPGIYFVKKQIGPCVIRKHCISNDATSRRAMKNEGI